MKDFIIDKFLYYVPFNHLRAFSRLARTSLELFALSKFFSTFWKYFFTKSEACEILVESKFLPFTKVSPLILICPAFDAVTKLASKYLSLSTCALYFAASLHKINLTLGCDGLQSKLSKRPFLRSIGIHQVTCLTKQLNDYILYPILSYF